MLNKLGTLLKYEFRFYFRILPPLYLMLMLIALILRLQDKVPETNMVFLYFFLYFVCIAMSAAMLMITLIHIIQRFNDNFMKDQGSLMFTLPVSIWTLISAKAIAALCMVLMSGITVYISIRILAERSGEWMSSFLTQTINLPVPNLGEILLIIFVVSAGILKIICLVYLAITVSHLLPRFRFAVGCGIYFSVTYFLEQQVFNFVDKNVNHNFASIEDFMYRFMYDNNFYISMIPSGITSLVFAALYFWATGFLLKRTFDLE
ncbi:MAG: hypothetical protein LBH97_05005 [Treponema sp.]|jgi:hypothetical protein|nr:hypothetical protein [Treponema sp.]